MNGKARHYFGNNTPVGFLLSLYSRPKARQIWCIKGGREQEIEFYEKNRETMLAEGHDVDFLHCSSDSNSLDGILLRDLKISLIDGTAPHVIDPVNPGAVDKIINLGITGTKRASENREGL